MRKLLHRTRQNESENMMKKQAYYHLPGLFEFYELYRIFLPLFRGAQRVFFYDWCEIGSIYGAPSDCIWGGGRTSLGEADPRKVLALMQEYKISARLTFSNSLLREEHLQDQNVMHFVHYSKKIRECKMGDHSFRSTAGLSAKKVSGTLSGFFDHKGADEFQRISGGNRQRRILLCSAGFSSQQKDLNN